VPRTALLQTCRWRSNHRSFGKHGGKSLKEFL